MRSDLNHNENIFFRKLGESSESAFNHIHQQYFSILVEYCREIISDKELAKDIVVDTLQLLWENRKAVAVMDKPGSWLFKCAYHRSLNELRRKKRKNTIPLTNHLDLDSHANIQADLEAREFLKYIDMALNKLPAQQKRIIQLSRECGLSRKEIARICNVSENTIKNQVTNAYKALRNEMKNVRKY